MNMLVDIDSLNKRKNIHIRSKSGIGLTPNWICQVINLSKGGVLLKCFQGVVFPHEWTMDIYSEAKLSIQGLNVKKIWAEEINNSGTSPLSQVIVGGMFENISSFQKVQIDTFLLQFMEV